MVAKDLDANDEWVHVCTRCDAELSIERDVKRYAASSMPLLGYDVGGTTSGGCGSGGCGSCASGT